MIVKILLTAAAAFHLASGDAVDRHLGSRGGDINVFFFATEMLVNALMMGYSWVEVPLTHHERTYGQSKAVNDTLVLSNLNLPTWR